MQIDINSKTIGELALEVPNAIPFMEMHHIDFCCRGNRSVAEACREAGMDPSELLGKIGYLNGGALYDWEGRSLTDLQQYIVNTHHTYTRQAVETITLLAEKVARRHGANHVEVMVVRDLALELAGDLLPHMAKEEQILFPCVEALEGGSSPDACFGTIANPIRAMMFEHEAAGEKLAELRRVTCDYSLPDDACLSFRALYESLAALERDLHQHIHLENNLLFPRAVSLEEATAARPLLEPVG
ncbi:MAG TPA: iron-sulfur cluster repair di-iron protein [Thermoanaerobaculia bacterium]|nr:iron-sulfur cluster repair di-iron protein [Thermoanaerobaculia bacterium]